MSDERTEVAFDFLKAFKMFAGELPERDVVLINAMLNLQDELMALRATVLDHEKRIAYHERSNQIYRG